MADENGRPRRTSGIDPAVRKKLEQIGNPFWHPSLEPIEREPIPQHILDLLRQLEER